jgi:hypothetical protein
MTCYGKFFQTEFDNLKRKKHELRKASLEGCRLMRGFSKRMLLQEIRQEELKRKLEEITRRKDKMLDCESCALGELDELAPQADDPNSR